MRIPPSSNEPELSPTQRYGLLIAAVAAALLGIATLDLNGTQAAKKQRQAAERSAECIVASALFVGVKVGSAP